MWKGIALGMSLGVVLASIACDAMDFHACASDVGSYYCPNGYNCNETWPSGGSACEAFEGNCCNPTTHDSGRGEDGHGHPLPPAK